MFTQKNNIAIFSLLLALVLAPFHSHADQQHTDMSLHHMHVMINHAVEMAAEGSSLVMLGKMDMSSDVDNLTIQHGEKMVASAKALIKSIVEGDAMQALHKAGQGKTPMMAYTHQLADAAMNYISMLENMPDGAIHQHAKD